MKRRRRYPQVFQESDGWSEWINPQMDDYRMACCDCGLVHKMQFRVFVKTKDNPDGSYRLVPVRSKQFGVQFRAGRDRRATAGMRQRKERG